MHTRKQLGSKGIIFELSLEGIPLYEEIYLASNIPPLESRDPPSLEKVPGEGSLVALEESGGRHFRDAFYKGTKRETFFHKRRRNAIRPVPLSLFAPFARIGGPNSFFQGIFYARAFDVFPLIHLLLELYLYIRSPVLYISQFELHEGNFVFGRIWDFWVDNKWRGNPYLLVFFFCKYKRVLWKFHSISREFPIRV